MSGLMILRPWISGPAEIRPKPLHPDPIPEELLYTMLLSWFVASALANVLSAVTKRRLLSLIVAWFNCLNLPLGTILGIFTLVILRRPSVVGTYDDAKPRSHNPWG